LEIVCEVNVLTTVKHLVRRTRQHHAIEHATLHVLAARFPHRRMAGYSDPGGFTIFCDLPLETVRRGVSDALLQLQSGQAELAIHPNCGTNLAVTALLATAAASVGGGRSRDPLARFTGGLALVMPALLVAQPLGLSVQRYTTLAAVNDCWIKDMRAIDRGPVKAVRVEFA
jgi:hypothetical protein